ncbi:MAG TPA: CpsD/CapB family tyrosine-protein kinase [Candidatus Acidoferrales bacterium]|nr:CpsD/CapB family tyrosine-protein kinase [Candidatus Acidoferrales bacterium]
MTTTPLTRDRIATTDHRDRGEGRQAWPIPDAEELFRSLYTGFDSGPATSLAVCSSVNGEGKTTTSLGIAIAIAQDLPDRRVVVVETDLWRAVFAKDFEFSPSPGLADVLLDRVPVSSALRPTRLDNLTLLPAGSHIANPQRLLRSSRMPEVIDALRRTHDVVVVDTPAVLTHSEVALLARMVEEVILVVRFGVTPARQLNDALARLRGANVRGILVNDTKSSVPELVRQIARL